MDIVDNHYHSDDHVRMTAVLKQEEVHQEAFWKG